MAGFNTPKSVALRAVLMAYLSTDHITPATGKTIAITISKNGGAYGNPSGGATNATEIGNGSYYVDLSTTDTGTAGPLFVLGTATGCDIVPQLYNVQDPTSATVGANVVQWGGGAVPAPAVTGVPKIDLTYILGTLLTETAGQIAGAFKKWFDVATPTGTVNSIPNAIAGAAGGLFIAGTNAATTITTALTTTFTGNLTGNVGGNVAGSVGSVTGNVGGNVAGSVASVVGNVGGNVAGGVGFVAGSIGGDLAGDVLGNVDGSVATLTQLTDTNGVETGLSIIQALRVIAAATGGTLSGAATTTITIKNAVANDKNRITATVDTDGNRTAIVYDLS